ncbi:hypothetical protein [Sphingomonas sp. PR090111-T3T-6A]|uniref:hypothetical protein n=1 Tax=Sphingomonas sp. PR090111-T3T-6A TaxID=685778 RepID=UPI00036969E7|nr:hypothetical protein [Sphingomonas sp. PR090111-T3T-6A]
MGHPAPQAIVIPRISSIGSDQAYSTLCTAALFFASGRDSPGINSVPPRYPSKVAGNGLRELDRFLNILLDEVAAEAGWSAEDLLLLARIRNTPNKLEKVCLRMNIEAGHDVPLRALGRCRDTLFHCGGVVRRGDDRDAQTLTLGWPNGLGGTVAHVLRIGDQLSLSPADLAWISRFYIHIGDLLRAG